MRAPSVRPCRCRLCTACGSRLPVGGGGGGGCGGDCGCGGGSPTETAGDGAGRQVLDGGAGGGGEVGADGGCLSTVAWRLSRVVYPIGLAVHLLFVVRLLAAPCPPWCTTTLRSGSTPGPPCLASRRPVNSSDVFFPTQAFMLFIGRAVCEQSRGYGGRVAGGGPSFRWSLWWRTGGGVGGGVAIPFRVRCHRRW